jgi:CRISPR type III-associated protein (TIGR04423 family)
MEFLQGNFLKTSNYFLAMNKPTEIPTKKYQGYVWLSDEKYPVVLLDKEYDFSTLKENQFVIEALLWNAEDGGTSIMIRHTGKYHIQEFKLNELPTGHELVEKVYLPHRLDKVKHVYFKQLWIPEPDAFCEGMEVMTMKALIFTGFNC